MVSGGRVEYSEWELPIIAVLKLDKENIQICSYFKQTVNPASKQNWYSIPRIEDLFSKLAGGKVFTKLDLSQAYLQIHHYQGTVSLYTDALWHFLSSWEFMENVRAYI